MARIKTIACSLTAQNTGSTQVDVCGQLSVDISGTWAATVYLQRMFDGTNWRDVESYTSNCQLVIEDRVGASYRLFIKTGGYTSGTMVGYLRAE